MEFLEVVGIILTLTATVLVCVGILKLNEKYPVQVRQGVYTIGLWILMWIVGVLAFAFITTTTPLPIWSAVVLAVLTGGVSVYLMMPTTIIQMKNAQIRFSKSKIGEPVVRYSSEGWELVKSAGRVFSASAELVGTVGVGLVGLVVSVGLFLVVLVIAVWLVKTIWYAV